VSSILRSERCWISEPVTFLWHFGTMPGHDLPLRGFAITLRHTTLGRTHLDKTSFRGRDLYLTTHKAHKRQTYMPPAGFEPTISEIEWTQIYNLDRATTGIGWASYKISEQWKIKTWGQLNFLLNA
jgi:hypothetical protein